MKRGWSAGALLGWAEVLAASAFSLLAPGCARARPPEVSPAVLADAARGVVAVATAAEDGADHVTLCSGALVAPNLVLTARHCVTRALTSTPACDAEGHSHNGVHLSADVDPGRITIYVGRRVRPDVDTPVARAERTLHPKGRVLCDADVAFLVLDRPVVGARVLPMRLHASVEAGDWVVPVGFGGGPNNIVGLRVARNDSRVLAIGPTANVRTGAVLGPREFEVDQATCRGDSGDPRSTRAPERSWASCRAAGAVSPRETTCTRGSTRTRASPPTRSSPRGASPRRTSRGARWSERTRRARRDEVR